MFNKQKGTTDTVQTTIIAENTCFKGETLSCEGSIRVDGKVECKLNATGTVNVGPQGEIAGDVVADKVLSSGKIAGHISCKKDIHLTTTANLIGNMECQSVIIDEGAIFCGNCTIRQSAETPRLTMDEKVDKDFDDIKDI